MENLNIVLPSTNAPESKALYDKIREAAAGSEDADLVRIAISGLFNIVAKLEAESHSDDD